MHAGGEANLVCPTCRRSSSGGDQRPHAADGRPRRLRARPAVRPDDVHQLKNLPVHQSMLEVSELIYETCKTYLITQGKFILILGSSSASIMVVYFGWLHADPGKPIARHAADHPALQPDRHRRQLRRRLVRHPRQHVRQLARRVRQPARQAVPDLRDSAAGRHEHRHAAHQRRAAADAAASCCSSRATTPGRASSASRSASRSAPRRCASPAASSPRSPTSART